MLRRYRSIRFGILAFAVVIGFAAQAAAAPITGSIRFAGSVAPVDYLTTTNIDIQDADVVAPGQNVFAICTANVPCMGAYSVFNGVFPPQSAIYNDFSWVGPLNGPAVPGGSITPLWSIISGLGNFSFDLTSITSITRSATGIVIGGFGIAHGSGYEDSLAQWSFDSSTSGGGVFAFASTTSAVPPVIPEPGSMLLLGTGLFGLAAAARRKLLTR